MRQSRFAFREIFDNPILVGTITILVTIVAVYLSYIAENGLPFVPTYNINVQVANASELVKNADVRIGGARVGQVLTITPEPATKTYPHPYAQLGLSLQRSLEPLPFDTQYQVRLASVLGGKYLELFPGSGGGPGVPDGGTLTISTRPRLDHNRPFVDIDTAFATFGPKTQRGLRLVIAELGDAVAGRGSQLNDATYATARLIGPLDSLLRLLASPSTHLSQFVSGLAATTGALAPVMPTLSSLLVNATMTFDALTRSDLGGAIDEAPPTEQVATTVLTNALPVLTDAASIIQSLKPGAALLPIASERLDAIVRSATPVFKQVPEVSLNLRAAFGAIDVLAKDPASIQTFQVLGSSNLATFGASAFIGLGAILQAVAGEQLACNVTGLWVRNFASSLSEGDNTGSWLRFAPIIATTQLYQTATPSADLHINPYPQANLTNGCQAGNEVYRGGQVIGDPGKTSTIVDNTTPPPGVLARGRKAGLVP